MAEHHRDHADHQRDGHGSPWYARARFGTPCADRLRHEDLRSLQHPERKAEQDERADAAEPTPASSARPRCPTSNVSTTVITLYDTVETAMGHANRMSSLRGLSFQARFMTQPAKFEETATGETDNEQKKTASPFRARGG